MKASQASDDTYSWTEDNLIASGSLSGNVVSLDVLANDRGGNAKHLWSVNAKPNNLGVADQATISNGKVLYDFTNSLTALGATSINALAAGDHIHDEFVYAIRMGNGTLSQATVVIDLWGVNDAAAISGNAAGSTVEDASTTAGGLLTVSDADHGQNVFQAVSAAAMVGVYGDFTFDTTSGTWGYTLDHARADRLSYDEVVHDKLTVQSADGTASQVIDVTISGAIDAPVVSASAAQTSIKQGHAVGLHIAATDVDAAASLSYAIIGVPDSATLTSAADPSGISYDAASQTWFVSEGALADLTLTPDADFSGEIDLTVTVTNTEDNPNNATDIATAAASAPIVVTVNPSTLTYTWTTLEFPDADNTFALGINDSNEVVGYYEDNTGTHGFLYDGAGYTPLDATSPYNNTVATAINGDGKVAGYFSGDIGSYGFVYDNGAYTIINPSQSSLFTIVNAINQTGEVVGYYYDGGLHGFLYDGTTSVTLDASSSALFTFANSINDAGEVAGYYQDNSGPHGFVYDSSGYIPLDPSPGATTVDAVAINNAGAVAGYYGDSAGLHGFLYDHGAYTLFDVPDASDTVVFDFNDVGQVLGVYDDSAGQHGFIYNTGSGTFTKLDDPSAVGATVAASINNSGAVAGYGDTHGFLVIPT